MKGKTKGVFLRGKIAYIRYRDECGSDVRESTGQSNLKVAELILAKKKTDVAMRKHFLVRRFDQVTFKELRDYWWKMHGQFTSSQFKYLMPRIDERFGSLRARDISSDEVHSFISHLTEGGLSASSVNHHRTILNSVFSFAVKRSKYDVNPVRTVPQVKEPPGRDRFPSTEEFQSLHDWCEENDPELDAFLIVAGTTSLRKNEILSRRWDEVFLDAQIPYVYAPRTKNGRPKKVPLPQVAVKALRKLSSLGKHEYLFPARPNPRFTKVSEFKKPHRWDMGRRFKRACREVGISDLRIHDLRHMVATVLMEQGIPEGVIRKLTGHRSRELERYQHLSEALKKQTVDVMAGQLFGTPTGTPHSSDKKPTQVGFVKSTK